ncbi:hypothetical protein AAZU54_01140 [Pseudomonas sp. Je.1.5.c]|jgi:hypothetical protein|uniref:hypothetical protein n=1 Tax=Pseudomonas sp. Je.1.5.c TaxID=3142839 RepID=UPI003DA9DB08
MKPFIFLSLFASLMGAASVPALADQDYQQTSWLKEPTEFLGVDLHSDFNKQIPLCTDNSSRPKTPCRLATSSPDRFEIRGLPYLPISPGYGMVAVAPHGKLTELVLSGSANSLHLVVDMLTDKFGEPGVVTSRWIKMSSGASFQSEVLKWEGEKVVMKFQRDEGNLSRYAVTVSVFTDATETLEIPETAKPATQDGNRDFSKI